MNRTLIASTLFVAACGGKSAAPSAEPIEQEAPDAGPAYAGLFQDGARWKLSVVTEDTEYASDRERVTTSEPLIVTCQVEQYAEIDGTKLAEITCGDGWPEMEGDPLTGAWAMTTDGVWRIPGFPSEGIGSDELWPEQMVIAARPTAGTTGAPADEENEGEGIEQTTIAQKGDAWCHSYMSAMGDEAWVTMCVDPEGPTEGSWGWAGGSAHEVKFTRAD